MYTKVLIVDASEEFRSALADELSPNHAVRSCGSGLEALELLRSYCPDFLVTDLTLPELDGLSMLRAAAREGICPPTIVAATHVNQCAVNALEGLNVVYMVLKPCRISELVSRIDELMCQPSVSLFLPPSPYSAVTAALLKLGVPTSRKGFRYSREAILLLSEDPTLQITKEVYPAVAKAFDTEAESVEKNIRDVIAAAWQHRDDAVWRGCFPTAPNGQIPRPSNGVFLTRLAEVLFAARRMVR